MKIIFQVKIARDEEAFVFLSRLCIKKNNPLSIVQHLTGRQKRLYDSILHFYLVTRIIQLFTIYTNLTTIPLKFIKKQFFYIHINSRNFLTLFHCIYLLRDITGVKR